MDQAKNGLAQRILSSVQRPAQPAGRLADSGANQEPPKSFNQPTQAQRWQRFTAETSRRLVSRASSKGKKPADKANMADGRAGLTCSLRAASRQQSTARSRRSMEEAETQILTAASLARWLRNAYGRSRLGAASLTSGPVQPAEEQRQRESRHGAWQRQSFARSCRWSEAGKAAQGDKSRGPGNCESSKQGPTAGGSNGGRRVG
jgi:hypothetical protein